MRWMTIIILLTGLFTLMAQYAKATPDPEQAVPLLRMYCKACHSFGVNEFIVSDNDEEVWNYINSEYALSNRLWINSIRAVLSWPTDVPPGPEEQAFEDVRLMPVGAKRYDMVVDVEEGKDARERLLSYLN